MNIATDDLWPKRPSSSTITSQPYRKSSGPVSIPPDDCEGYELTDLTSLLADADADAKTCTVVNSDTTTDSPTEIGEHDLGSATAPSTARPKLLNTTSSRRELPKSVRQAMRTIRRFAIEHPYNSAIAPKCLSGSEAIEDEAFERWSRSTMHVKRYLSLHPTHPEAIDYLTKLKSTTSGSDLSKQEWHEVAEHSSTGRPGGDIVSAADVVLEWIAREEKKQRDLWDSKQRAASDICYGHWNF